MAGRVHLLVPSLHDATVARGGINFYRGTAAALTGLGPVTCYEIARAPTADALVHEPATDGPGGLAGVLSVRTAGFTALCEELAGRTVPGEVVVKFVGTAGLDDWRLDLEVARLCWERGCHGVYVDPDAPSRLALLGDGAHLRAALPYFAGVVLFAGGARAVHEYRRIAPVPCWHASAALTVLGFGEPPAPAGPWQYDALFCAAGRGSREHRAAGVIGAWLRARPRLRVLLVGHWPTAVINDRRIDHRPFTAPADLQVLYRQSRFVVNLLRRDFAGYSDTAAARVFEAAWAGSCLLSESFPGLANYLEPDLECLVSTDLAADVAVTDLPEHRRRLIAARAQQRVTADARTAAQHLVRFVGDVTTRSGAAA